jgi:hypothetical protein
MSTTISGTNGVTFPDSTSMQTGQQACKAWVNFNGTGTVAIRGGYNVSSITDNGTGDYTVNFSTAMPNANYSGVSGMTVDGSITTNNPRVAEMINTSASTMRMKCLETSTGTSEDMNSVYVAIFSN